MSNKEEQAYSFSVNEETNKLLVWCEVETGLNKAEVLRTGLGYIICAIEAERRGEVLAMVKDGIVINTIKGIRK